MSYSNITKKALAQALKDLMLQEPLSKISVGDICTRCSMNRKSFYYHFKDKYDLVNWIYYTEFLDALQKKPAQGWDVALRLCEYFAENVKFYQNALAVQGQNSFYEYFGQVLSTVISHNLEPYMKDVEYFDFYIKFYSDAYRAVIIHWLTDGTQIPPAKFVELLAKATEGFYYVVNEVGLSGQEATSSMDSQNPSASK